MATAIVDDLSDASEAGSPGGTPAPEPSHRSGIVAWLPAVLVAVVAVVSLLRNDVEPGELLAYSVYWIACILAPGTLIFRAVFGPRRHVPHDLLLGGVTGLALEILVWRLLRVIGLEVLTSWWWLPVLIAFAAIPTLRAQVTHRFASPVPRAWAWTMSAVSALVVMGTDRTWLQVNPLPPAAGNVHRDAWWHLSIVHELMRSGPTQTPQVAGEPFSYHFNAHIHASVGARVWGLDPEIVLFRLWLIPMVLLAVGLIAVLATEVSGRLGTGPVAAWLTFGALGGGYLWTDLPNGWATPIRLASPSQIFALPMAVAGAWVCVRILRERIPAAGWLWLVMIAFVGAGSKPTVVPVLLGGTGLALVMVVLTRRELAWRVGAVFGCLLGVQAWSMLLSSDGASPTITLLGSLKSLAPYQEIVGDTTYRGINDGLLLDSLSGTRALVGAAVTMLWIFGSQLIRLIGLTALFHSETRRDPVAWWLAGAGLIGWAVFWIIDLSSFGQGYFLHMSLPFGAVLTAWMVTVSVSRLRGQTAAMYVGLGLVAGAVIAVVAAGVTTASAGDSFGMIDRVMVPAAVVVGAFVVGALAWLRWRDAATGARGAGFAVMLAAVIGMSLPTSIASASETVTRWVQPTLPVNNDPSAIEYVSVGEKEAARWLGENAAADDVVATNSPCQPPTDDPRKCNAIGFWLSGISGRRVVLEGWGYTPEAHANHGVNGLHRNRQPSPWPERYDLSKAAFEAPTRDVLDRLRDEYGATWLFGVRRAGELSPDLDTLAAPVFDNGDVVIYRLT